MVAENLNARPWYKERWPWILMAGPFVVIVAGVITVWLAVVSNDGLVADDYYKQGLAVNQRLHRDQNAGAIGLHADLMLSGDKLRLLLGANGAAQLPETLSVKFSHPTKGGLDQLVAMKAESGGMYSGQLNSELAGRWLVSIEDPDGKWRLQGEWVISFMEPLRLTAKIEQQ